MKHFTSANDVTSIPKLIASAKDCKQQPFKYENLGKRKTLGLIFMNPSLRTRLSSQKAGRNLGMEVMVMNPLWMTTIMPFLLQELQQRTQKESEIQ